MKFSSALFFFAGLISPVALHADGVAVGSSDLIGTLQYSDTFTIGSGASTSARQAYTAQSYPLPTGVGAVENNYGNPADSWGTSAFSIATDSSFYGGSAYNPYPGSSGAGSATGFTQTGLPSNQNSSEEDFGIAYGLSNNFVVQVDAVQVNDRIDINIGGSNGTIGSSDGLSVFFRQGVVGLYNASVHETTTAFVSGVTDNTWNNYAVDFNLAAKTLSLYTNENLIGTINLATFDGGAYAAVLDANSNAYVGVGGAEPTNTTDPDSIGLLWTDNFEVGTAPEPTTWAMLIGGLGVLAGISRLHRRNG